MKTMVKVFIGITLSFVCLFTCVGYALVNEELNITGTVIVEHPVFTEIVITEAVEVSDSTGSQSASRLYPTNLKTVISGNAGEKIIYKITAHNYSETETYVFSGAVYDDVYASVGNKLTISTSTDEANSNVIPASKGANYYEGTPVAPGEEITFYATYTLDANITSGEMMVNFKFLPIIYTIKYMNENEIYAVDCITNNEAAYTVKTDGPDKTDKKFIGWINTSGEVVKSYAENNTNSYTLSAKWENEYLIMFVDNEGNMLYQETFTESSTGLSSEGQRIVDKKLAELRANAELDMSVSWESYDIANASSDITVRPVYTYNGNLQYTPKDDDGDGIVDRYEVDAVSALEEEVTIMGKFNGKPVTQINKLYKNEGNTDYSSKVHTVIVQEGVQRLEANALSHTAKLANVSLPSTLNYLGKNAFSRNNWLFGGSNNDLKVLTITFNGTRAEWKEIVANSHNEWHNGLKDGSKVICTDGYFELDRGLGGVGGYTWSERSN